mmetsp:Transcript_32799/g.48845  ORF Transcript_32799/g.48845 Transcript_32799/m.48845 type:complete len:644 (-) Transcript_32799:415-2346(-)
MKLDPTVMRTMNKQDYRVLGAVEIGMKNHSLVPAPLISSIAKLRHGGTSKILSSLLRDKLLSHDQSCGYDGYRLTNSGYDVLALHHLKSRGLIAAIGDKIGTGKESDVYLAATPDERQVVLKFHRLGRTSFRDVKKKRDYFMVNAHTKHRNRRGGGMGSQNKSQPNSWLFLSRISALKEYSFMKALHSVGYPTPSPIGHSRHIVVMGLVRGVPLYQVRTSRISAAQAADVFRQSADLAVRLAKHGLVHCDLNEFNLMVDLSGVQHALPDNHDEEDYGECQNEEEASAIMTSTRRAARQHHDDISEHYVRHSGLTTDQPGALSGHGPMTKRRMDGTGEVITEKPPEPAERLKDTGEPKPIVTLIDFPQMVSVRHPNAEELYERDVMCLKRFFASKLKCRPDGVGVSGLKPTHGGADDDEVGNTDEDDGWGGIFPSFKDLVQGMDSGDNGSGSNKYNPSLSDEPTNLECNASVEERTCLASNAQLRLDEELCASGFSVEDSKRDVELYYYEQNHVSHSHDSSDDDDEVEISEEDEKVADDEDLVYDNISEGGKGNLGDIEETEIYDGAQNILIEIDDAEKHSDSVTVSSLFTQKTQSEIEERARARVRQQLNDRKKNHRRKGAFRTRNSNKTFVKGTRVMKDVLS